jgi:hypothetical protein
MVTKIKLSKITTTAAIAVIAAMAAIGGIGQQQIALAQEEIGYDVNPILDEVNEALDESGVDREIACPERFQVNGFCGPVHQLPEISPRDGIFDVICQTPGVFCRP